MNIPQKTEDNVIHTYGRPPFTLVSGQGMIVTDSEGNEYLDFGSGIGVVNVGYNVPEINAAMFDQAQKTTFVFSAPAM